MEVTSTELVENNKALYEDLLYRMACVRRFEEEARKLCLGGQVHGTLHLCEGEEAAAVGSTAALKPQDYVLTTHRGHGVCIGKGADIKHMMAEILGRRGSSNRGVGGSMHISDIQHGIVGSNGVVGANAPVACGIALKLKTCRVSDTVAAVFFGDGAANQGAVLESMNLAGVWKLPLIFVLIDNSYAVSTPPERASADPDFIKRAEPFGLKSFEADGNDAAAVYETMCRARAYTAGGGGPALVVEHCYRLSGHSRSDKNKYRTGQEIETHWKQEPVRGFADRLTKEGIFTGAEVSEIYSRADAAVMDAVAYALGQQPADYDAPELEGMVYAE